MAEYNFWDDRTAEENDEHFCPVLNDFCFEDKEACKTCITLKAFTDYYSLKKGND